MAVIGTSREIHARMKYIIEIDGVAHSGWSTCSALKSTFQQMEYYEGGSQMPEKQATRRSTDDITLERAAATGDRDMWDWHLQVGDGAIGAGLRPVQYKRNLDIVQQAADGSELRRWTVYNAWPKEYTAGEWDNTSDDATMEQVVLTCDYFELTYDAGGQG